MKQKLRPLETAMNVVFLICGFIAIAFVLFISIYLIAVSYTHLTLPTKLEV